ncbi:hypothetical protein [Burkholderia cenocepacia]|uniref:hypothetical protein n=1 Tax=Burkholderia cenocepacia TaxID=95486 RepID=UPI002AAFD2A3|nr:hypothetical protein [Burkholderia cenocepacia]
MSPLLKRIVAHATPLLEVNFNLYHVRQSDCGRVRHPVARGRFNGGADGRISIAAPAGMLPVRSYRAAVVGAAIGLSLLREPIGRH